jgi:pimeloyl-ACP methyl ester carboxylesterase
MSESAPPQSRPSRRTWLRRVIVRSVLIALCLALLAGLAIVLAVFIQYRRNDRPIVLPSPRGPHRVGRVLVDWKDGKRDRELMVFVWYPAKEGTDGLKCDYIPGRWGEIESAKMLPIPAHRYQQIEVSSIEDAPFAPGSHPVLILLPGLGRIPPHYTVLAEELASHGYLVAGVAPTDYSSVVVFSDGRQVTAQEFDPSEGDPSGSQKAIDIWAADASFVLDRLTAEPRFSTHINPKKVGILGHSFGGCVAAHSLTRDPRFLRAAVLDSAFFGEPMGKLNRPLQILQAGTQLEPEWQTLCVLNGTQCKTQVFPGAQHMDFSDATLLPSRFPLPRSLLMLGEVDGLQLQREVSERLREFFDEM